MIEAGARLGQPIDPIQPGIHATFPIKPARNRMSARSLRQATPLRFGDRTLATSYAARPVMTMRRKTVE
jgi:hypothetical protein